MALGSQTAFAMAEFLCRFLEERLELNKARGQLSCRRGVVRYLIDELLLLWRNPVLIQLVVHFFSPLVNDTGVCRLESRNK